MKQTAVEWLANQISEIIGKTPLSQKQEEMLIFNMNQALEMEEEQHQETFKQSRLAKIFEKTCLLFGNHGKNTIRKPLNQNKMTIKEWLKDVYYDEYGTHIWNREDEDGGSQLVAEIRGWGRLQNEFPTEKESEKFQDEVGEFIVQAIREKVERDFKSE